MTMTCAFCHPRLVPRDRDWPDQLKSHMMAAFNTEDPAVAGSQLDDMLASLGDPYTRHISAT